MQALTMLAGLLVAALGQKLNANPRIPSMLVKLSLAAIGPIIYLIVEQPTALYGPGFLTWLDHAWIWALALPGAASLIGLAPGMATNSKEEPTMKSLSILLLFCLVFILPSGAKATYAADAPAFSMKRVLVTAGLDYAKNSAAVGHNYGRDWELKPSLNVAYNLGNHVSLISSYSRGLKSEANEYKVGFRLRLYRGASEAQ